MVPIAAFDAIPTDNAYELGRTGSQHLIKQISQTNVKFFNYPYVDTSSITWADYGEEFENY